jgi:hypothetical protein
MRDMLRLNLIFSGLVSGTFFFFLAGHAVAASVHHCQTAVHA